MRREERGAGPIPATPRLVVGSPCRPRLAIPGMEGCQSAKRGTSGGEGYLSGVQACMYYL